MFHTLDATPASFSVGRLWSLWDMLRIRVSDHILLGMEMHDTWAGVFFNEGDASAGHPATPLDDEDKARIAADLKRFLAFTERFGLKYTSTLLKSKIAAIPQTSAELDMLWVSMKAELDDNLFLYVPTHRSGYYEKNDALSESARKAFPSATREVRQAGNAFAAGLNTACVFHCMRALEHGLRALAEDVGKSFGVQNWQNVIDQIESEIKAIAKQPAGQQKSDRLQFLSESAKQFSYFKDGWRNYVAHGHATYEEPQAVSVMGHVIGFLETLSGRLSERPAP